MAMVRNRAWAVVGCSALAAGAVACSAILGDFDTTGGPPLPDGGTDSPIDTGTDHASPPVDAGQDVAPPVDGGSDAPTCGANGQACCSGNTCSASLMCTGGTCQPCPTGQAFCGGACVDTQSSNTNCGGCGLTCSACNAGECLVTLASNLPNAYGIAINAVKAYVTSYQANGDIYEVSLSGGGAINLTPNYPQNQPVGIVVDAQNIYWTDFGGGTVMKMPLGGQVAPTTIASGQQYPAEMAIDATNLYWTNFNDPGAVMKAPLGGGAASTLVSGVRSPSGIAVDATYAYVAAMGDDYVIKAQLSTGAIVAQITNLENNPYGLAIDQNNVYFTNQANTGDVRQVAKTDTKVDGTILLDKLSQPGGVATDGTSVYWVAGNAVYKAQVGVAGSGKVIAANQNGASFVAVDSKSVYWTNMTSGTVMKLTPK